MTREEAILNAWNKIKIYVKGNFDGTFENGIEFEWKHACYYWIKFGVTNKGVAYIVKGSHGWGGDYFYHPYEKNFSGLKSVTMGVTEMVVSEWKLIKEELIRLAKKENELYNFEV